MSHVLPGIVADMQKSHLDAIRPKIRFGRTRRARHRRPAHLSGMIGQSTYFLENIARRSA